MASASASATATGTDADDNGQLRFESLPLIDLRLFSQSELYSLSLHSVASPSPSSQDDVVVPIPKIDRSVFNESAGSRKQTYFRLRLAPRTTSNPPHPPAPVSRQKTPEPFEEENSRIISLLKGLFAPHAESKPPIPDSPEDESSLIAVPVRYDECVPESSNSVLQNIPISVVDLGFSNQKRGRPRKVWTYPLSFENLSEEKEILVFEDNEGGKSNEKGSLVVAGGLDRLEDELRRRTEGMRTEEELSGFLRGLSGEWGSRRKKRKIVDAKSFGDVLPVGWKLLLSIKNDGDRVWLGCSRYISPEGQQFVSSKDVSAHLFSSLGVQDATQETSCLANESSQLACRRASENSADPSLQMDHNQNEVVCLSAVPISSIPADNLKEGLLPTSGRPGKVEMKGRYRCHKCVMTFEEKDNLLLHLLSSHKKSRNARNGAADNDSIMMKDGKYECQLCHKLFEEKNRFSSHFGNHIKDYVRRVEASEETNCVHRRAPKVQEPTSVGGVSGAVLKKSEAFERSTVCLSHAKFESDAISKTQPSSDGHHINISTVKVVAVSESKDEVVTDYTKKQEGNADLSNDNVGVVDEADKSNADLDISKNMTAVLSIAQNNGTSETPEKTSAFEKEKNARVDSFRSMEDCSEGMVPMNGVFAPPENNNAVNNESLVNSLFGSPMEDMDMDDGDGVGDNVLIPGIEDRCFGLGEGVINSGLQQITSQGCPLVQFGHEENCNHSDDVAGCQTSVPQNECDSEKVLSPNVNQNKVIGDRLEECGSYSSWNSRKTINFGQIVVERAVQQADTGFDAIPAVDQQTCNLDIEGFSGSKVRNPWQQQVFESSLVSVHQKSLSPDANMGKISSSTMRNFQTFAESQPDSAVLGHVEKKMSSVGNLPATPPDRQAFALNNDEAQDPTFNKPKAYRGFTGLYAGEQNCVDKNNGSLTVSDAVDDHKKEELMSSNWSNKSSFSFGSQDPLQHGGPFLGFEAWANPRSRSNEAVTSEHGGATFFGNAIEQSKQNKESAFGLPSRSVAHPQASVTSYNLHMLYGGVIPDNCRAGNVGFLGNNERTIGLYTQQQPKPREEAVIQSMLRVEQNVNILQNSSLNYVPPSVAQPSDCFPAFNMASDKVPNEFHASIQKPGNAPAAVEGTRTSGSGGFMEYNFLSAPSSSQGAHISSFSQQIGEGFESNWVEKEALGRFPKVASSGSSSSGSRHHQVTALCVWCGNQFSHDGDLDVGDGSVGYMCFNCKAKFAGQINFF